jgi:hypothetical protein
MVPPVYATTSYPELERFIHQALCDHERFDPASTVLRKTALRQAGRVVGIMLRVEGSRLHRSHAVWADAENRVLFYNSAGQRFGEMKLAESPDIRTLPEWVGSGAN